MMRRLLTRCLGLVPALVVAAAVGRAGIDALLVASQVTLSIVLPFIVFPLMYLTSSKTVMSVKKPLERSTAQGSNAEMRLISGDAGATEEQVEMVDYSNGKIAMAFGWLIWLVVVMANVYAIVGLGLGEGA